MIFSELGMEDSLSEKKSHNFSSLQFTDKLSLSSTPATVSRPLSTIPNLEPTDKQTPPHILVNEIKIFAGPTIISVPRVAFFCEEHYLLLRYFENQTKNLAF